MKVIADLQLHSKYSRAVSQNMVIEEIAKWGRIKGIGLLATGDWTHPLWIKEIKEKLTETSPGLYGLKAPVVRGAGISGEGCEPLFLLSGEVSSIYSQGGSLRRVHNLIFAPSFEVVEKINKKLTDRGARLMSDGRPIVGLSSKEICEIVFSVDSRCLVIPAHAYTPWFSLYGSRSGFDSIDECFGNFAPYIYAVETGLSSSPAMNWRIKELDGRSIISSSDAHSGVKLGREATVFNFQFPISNFQNNNGLGDFCYQDVVDAIKQNPQGRCEIAYTIEFYPEEGKYHFNGHRNCNVSFSPQETREKGTICPVCGKPLTLGVLHRVEELAGRSEAELELYRENGYMKSKLMYQRPGYVMTVPLLEIISESLSISVGSKKTLDIYLNLCERLGGEFSVLLKSTVEEIARVGGQRLARGVEKVRKGEISVKPGFDGVFGEVRLGLPGDEKEEVANKQLGLF